jgi:hypothetical protein
MPGIVVAKRFTKRFFFNLSVAGFMSGLVLVKMLFSRSSR